MIIYKKQTAYHKISQLSQYTSNLLRILECSIRMDLSMDDETDGGIRELIVMGQWPLLSPDIEKDIIDLLKQILVGCSRDILISYRLL